MKKLLIALAVFGSAALNAAVDEDTWKFEPTIGPGINIRNYSNQFDVNLKMGKEMFGFSLDSSFGSSISFKPTVTFDYPFYLTLDKSDDFAVGPTADLGPSFYVDSPRAIDFFEVGMGVRVAYQINDNFGVVAVPVHFSMSFLRWVSGGSGFNANFNMSYDMKFGVYLLL
jgi:hypothetical protein